MDSPQEKLGHFNFFFLFPCVVITHLLLIAGPMSQRKAILCVDLLFLYHLSSFFFFQSVCVCIFVRTHTGRLQTRAKIRTVRTSWIRQALLSLAKIQTARNKGNKKKRGRRRRKTTNDQNGQPAKQSIMRKVCQFVTRELIINQFFST